MSLHLPFLLPSTAAAEDPHAKLKEVKINSIQLKNVSTSLNQWQELFLEEKLIPKKEPMY